MSRLDLIVGPNGAGKTTLFERAIAPVRPGLPFVTADRIASDRFPGQEVHQAYAAARIADTARQALIDVRLDFCAKTEFSHESKIDLVAGAAGYAVVMHVVVIPLALSEPGGAPRQLRRRRTHRGCLVPLHTARR